VALRARLDRDGLAPSAQLRRLARWQDLLESRRNVLFAPLALPLLWTTQIALAIEAWRRRVGPAVPEWLAAIGDFEALCALASYAYERPADVFPEIVEGHVVFDAAGLGHPLIPAAACVRNDVQLDDGVQLLLLTGSNMSGKSTLLRAIGVNTVLARAGAPVCARTLRTAPFTLGASIRVQDSLEGGRSRFYAEISRLRQLMDLARERPPLLFLLDEVLHGTNSDDRRVGAEAVIRGLVERAAVGIVTSHDLALARIADDLAPRARNVHFEDHLEDGRIAFDYRLKDGVVRRSNALALMRAVGLEV
jgi:DNA mismatch repair ATPase MutS